MKKTTRLGDVDTQGRYVALGHQRTIAPRRYSGKASKGGLQFGGLVFLLGLLGLSCEAALTDESPVKGGYWTVDLETVFPPKSIPSNLYTHLFFAFVGFNNSTFQVTPGRHAVAELLASFSATVKLVNPSVKTLISIGGGVYSEVDFANMTSQPAYRSAFIKSSIALARENGFDGVDLDYEYPDSVENMALWGTFLDEWRAGVTAEAQETSRAPLLLTAAVYYSSSRLFSSSNASYPIPSITRNLDFVNLMLYDLHGPWDTTRAEYNAPLFATGSLSLDYGVQKWLTAGLPPSKAVFGLPAYGYSWILEDKSKTAPGSAATGLAPAQNVSGARGLFVYSEIAEFIKREDVVSVYDAEVVSSYAYDATGVWVGYDSPESIAAKVLYSKQWKLRGYFFWSVSYDDTESSLGEAASRALDSPPPSAEAPSPVSGAVMQPSAEAPPPISGAASLHGSFTTAGLLWATGMLLLSKGIGAI